MLKELVSSSSVEALAHSALVSMARKLSPWRNFKPGTDDIGFVKGVCSTHGTYWHDPDATHACNLRVHYNDSTLKQKRCVVRFFTSNRMFHNLHHKPYDVRDKVRYDADGHEWWWDHEENAWWRDQKDNTMWLRRCDPDFPLKGGDGTKHWWNGEWWEALGAMEEPGKNGWWQWKSVWRSDISNTEMALDWNGDWWFSRGKLQPIQESSASRRRNTRPPPPLPDPRELVDVARPQRTHSSQATSSRSSGGRTTQLSHSDNGFEIIDPPCALTYEEGQEVDGVLQ